MTLSNQFVFIYGCEMWVGRGDSMVSSKSIEKVYQADLESKHREVNRNRVSVSSRPAWNISGYHKRYKTGGMNGNSMQVVRG